MGLEDHVECHQSTVRLHKGRMVSSWKSVIFIVSETGKNLLRILMLGQNHLHFSSLFLTPCKCANWVEKGSQGSIFQLHIIVNMSVYLFSRDSVFPGAGLMVDKLFKRKRDSLKHQHYIPIIHEYQRKMKKSLDFKYYYQHDRLQNPIWESKSEQFSCFPVCMVQW